MNAAGEASRRDRCGDKIAGKKEKPNQGALFYFTLVNGQHLVGLRTCHMNWLIQTIMDILYFVFHYVRVFENRRIPRCSKGNESSRFHELFEAPLFHDMSSQTRLSRNALEMCNL